MNKETDDAQYILSATDIEISDAHSVGISSDGGGERGNNDSSDDETHTEDNGSQDDESTGLSTNEFEALDRKQYMITD